MFICESDKKDIIEALRKSGSERHRRLADDIEAGSTELHVPEKVMEYGRRDKRQRDVKFPVGRRW